MVINTKDGLQAARERKRTKPSYIALINDLEAMRFSANLDTLEVGSLGHFDKEAIATLHAILPNLTRSRISRLLLELSKIAVGCSSHIFHAEEVQLGTCYSFVPNVNYNLVHIYLCLALCHIVSVNWGLPGTLRISSLSSVWIRLCPSCLLHDHSNSMTYFHPPSICGILYPLYTW